tara:strand:+ start:13741 stop:14484 length:744 start_codon:yes stop_codon:yes gene_type:complete
MDPESVAVYNNKTIYNVQPGNDWNAIDGQYSLRFRYTVGEPMAEQRFNFSPQRDIWLSYWIRVPINYQHGSGGGSATNNKFLALWTDGYSQSGQGSTFWLSLENAGGGNSYLAFTNTLGYGNASQGMQQHIAFINAATDKGKWMQMVVHLVAETSDGASDGIVQTWRRWENESNFTQLHDANNRQLRIPSNGPAGFSAGYLMGWANGTYDEITEWLIDDVTIANTSLLTVTSKAPANPPPAFDAKEN